MYRVRRYLRQLLEQLTDDSYVVIELYLLWIAVALTFLSVCAVLYYVR